MCVSPEQGDGRICSDFRDIPQVATDNRAVMFTITNAISAVVVTGELVSRGTRAWN